MGFQYNAKLISSTNPIMEKFIDKRGMLVDYSSYVLESELKEIQIGGSAYFEMYSQYMYTSEIKNIDIHKNIIVITTNNSVYTFERI